MKIAVIHSIYHPETRGGAEVAVGNIVDGLVKRGEEVVVVCVGRKNNIDSPTPPWPPLGQRGKLEVYRIKPANLFNFLDINRQPAWWRLPWHLFDMFNGAQARQVKKILEKEKPDLVLTHNLKGLGYLIPGVIRKLGLKNIHTVHDMQLLHPSGLLVETRFIASPLVVIYRYFCKKLFTSPKPSGEGGFGSPSVVVFPSQYIKGVYEEFGFFEKSKRVVIGNPVLFSPPSLLSFPRILSFANDGRKRESNGKMWDPRLRGDDREKREDDRQGKAGGFQLLFLGQVEAYKGIFELIEAIKGVKGDWTLNVVGDGKALPAAKIAAQKAFPDTLSGARISPGVNPMEYREAVPRNGGVFHGVKFWGRLGQEELEEQVWPQIDLLVNPSQTAESFGMVVVEAYAHGVPVLVSDKGALPELVRDGETGFVCRDALREKVLYCLTHRAELAAMRENCLKEAEKYGIEGYLNKLLKSILPLDSSIHREL